MMTADFPEEEVLSREDGRRLAEACRNRPIPESLKDVPPSLLSAEHIRDFVMATGLISPFHLGGKKRRLKKASYEGRIGQKAYIFRNERVVPAKFTEGRLFIPANSIVFVESDLDFRLPEYVALRFNLHIDHVHRGLLLGTGPLVDPGFWGKLCIPLHNLTSEDYEISRSDGLIWLEFTKTTSDLVDPGEAIGVDPSNTEYWDILKFIKKAAKGVGGASNVPIQSSIGGVLLEAKRATEEASKWTRFVSIAIGAAVIAAISLIGTMFNAINGQANLAKQYIDTTKATLEAAVDKVDHQFGRIISQEKALEGLSSEVTRLKASEKQIFELQQSVRALEEALSARESSTSDSPAPAPKE